VNCPVCLRKLTEIKVGSVLLDICQGGCGGVWFDASELDQVNKQHRKSAAGIKITRNETITVDDSQLRHCPACSRTKLVRRLFSLGTGVEMDCCPKCEGVWLDFGELEAIQEETNPKPRPVRHVVPRKSSSLAVNFNVVEQIHAQQVAIRHQNQRPAR
jgi:Zn-finger nucleic acid-binding protein